MARGDLDHGNQSPGVRAGARIAHNPRTHRASATAAWYLPSSDLVPRHLVRQLDDDAVFYGTDTKTALYVPSRQAVHPVDADARAFVDELHEKDLEIGSKRNGHDGESSLTRRTGKYERGTESESFDSDFSVPSPSSELVRIGTSSLCGD